MKTRLKNFVALACVLISVGLIFAYTQLPLQLIDSLPDSATISWDDLVDISYKKTSIDFDIAKMVNLDGSCSGEICIKAFGFFPLRRVKVKVDDSRKVYKGGQSIGMMLACDGVLVVSCNNPKPEKGKKNTQLKKGDIIKKVNGISILQPEEIAQQLGKCNGNTVVLAVERDGKLRDIRLNPVYDDINKEYKLGAWVKDKVAGLGTVSYVKLDGRFGALGHPVVDSDTDKVFPLHNGTVYGAKIVGVEKGEAGKAGSLRGIFSAKDSEIGTVNKNNKYGIFGDLPQYSGEVITVGSRLGIKPGKAKILSTVTDLGLAKEYDIEIIKVFNQRKNNDKSMVIKVVDKELLGATGGIVQGMSGSPIIQNDKVVGALTHVFVNDPTRGYGIYMDWMYDN